MEKLASASVSDDAGLPRVILSGRVVMGAVEDLRALLEGLAGDTGEDVTVVFDDVEAFDTAGAWLIASLGPESRIRLEGASESQERLVSSARELMATYSDAEVPEMGLRAWVEKVGENTVEKMKTAHSVVEFLGATLVRIALLVRRPGRLRLASLTRHMQETGLQAIPIVVVMSFLIGIVLAFQGASQLSRFGAEIFVVELIAISILRELGSLLTAIIVAGRTGAAFTSAIGSMKMREELDAMRTLGLDPIEVLVVPRVLALMITLPILGFVADISGLVGGALMSWSELGVSPGAFQTRLSETVNVSHYVIGLAKTPFFALIIAVVGCQQGFSVGSNAESLGRMTSRSVVISIFMVIVLDALFSVFFALVGV